MIRLSKVAAVALAASLATAATEPALAASPPPGTIALSVRLEADGDAAARTWRFAIVDETGHVVKTVSLPLSGEAPTAAATITDLPDGDYDVQPIFSADLGRDCLGTAHFAIRAGESSEALGTTSASFVISVCPVDVAASVAKEDDLVTIDPPTSTELATPASEDGGMRPAILLAGGLAALVTGFAAVRMKLSRRGK